MRKLLKYLSHYKKETVLAPLFKLLEAAFELLVPLVMASIIDRGIADGDRPHVFWMGGILLGLGIIGLTCSLTAQFFAAKAAVRFTAKIKNVLFRHIFSFSYSQLDRLGSSTLITRMTSDMNQVQSGVNLVLRLFLRSPFIVFGAMIMAFFVDVKAALVFVVVIPLLAIVVFGIMLLNIPIFKKVQNRLDTLTRNTRENMVGSRVIRAFGLQKEWTDEFAGNNQSLLKVQLLGGRISALMNPFTYVLINTALVVLIYVGALRVEGGFLSQGQVVALVNYMSQILVELIKLANLIISTTKAVACGNRIQSILDIEPEKNQGDLNIQSIEKIEFSHVGFCYDNAKEEALTDINFTIKKGQTIGIIGGTGSGKSTLVNLICGYYHATRGKISINDSDIDVIQPQSLLDKIGIVPQKAVLFSGTVEDNLRWRHENACEEELWEAVENAQARDFLEKKEGMLKAKVAQGGKNFSGGQRQRLTIARALVGHPQLLILDDSTSALDYNTDAALRNAIAKLPDHPIVIIVSQRTNSISNADQILVMDDGELVGVGTHNELLKNCAVYQEIFNSQFSRGGEKQ